MKAIIFLNEKGQYELGVIVQEGQNGSFIDFGNDEEPSYVEEHNIIYLENEEDFLVLPKNIVLEVTEQEEEENVQA